QGVGPLDVWYYGTDPALRALPLHDVPLHTMPIRAPDDVAARVRGHYLAVSTTLLYGMTGDSEALRNAVAFLKARRPIAHTTTFFIYDFTDAPKRENPAATGAAGLIFPE